MGNRFHNKYHNKMHHTDPTAGYIDSAVDPIASYNHPFEGDFYINGNIQYGNHSINGGDAHIHNISSIDGTILNLIVNSITGSSNIIINSNIDLNGHLILGYTLGSVEDVVLTSPSDGQILVFSGGSWVNEDFCFGIATNSEFSDGTATDKVPNVHQIHMFDSIYTPLNGGTHNLMQTDESVYTYNISEFTSLEYLDTDEIRGIYVECFLFSPQAHNQNIYAKYPNDGDISICNSYGQNNDDDCGNGVTVCVPINPGQQTFKIYMTGGGTHRFSLRGVQQRYFG